MKTDPINPPFSLKKIDKGKKYDYVRLLIAMVNLNNIRKLNALTELPKFNIPSQAIYS